MGLNCGIVGLPNVGKSTLFNCLSNAKAQAANFPFCTIEPNVGIVAVPDERLGKLSELVHPKKITPAAVEIVDIAGLVKGASKGEGLGNQFLGHIRETDAILHVLRCFEDTNIIHVDGKIDPVRDKETVDFELQMKDLEIIEKKIQKIEKTLRAGDKESKEALEISINIKDHLGKGNNVRTFHFEKGKEILLKDTYLLTSKPVLYVCNVDEKSVLTGNKFVDSVKEIAKRDGSGVVIISAAIEAEIATLDSEEERKLFLSEMGLTEPGVNKVIKEAYKLLNLYTYFTAGEDEVRAWTIKAGMTAPKAAGVIHSDFEKGFIRAEVIKYSDYMKLRSENACKEAGKMAIEGKEYLVQDGDVMHFRFSV